LDLKETGRLLQQHGLLVEQVELTNGAELLR
jgi:hypothetical protein